MRLVVLMGVVLLGLLAAAFFLNRGSATPEAAALVALDAVLERPLVVYIDGAVSDGLNATLRTLDAGTGALAAQAAPRTLVDLDAYVMLRDNWDVFRAIEGHDLTDLIRSETRDKADNAGVAWFEAALTSPQGVEQTVLVVLATEAALENLGEFCFALTIYELARFARNGPDFTQATSGPGTRWKQCSTRGWNSAADLPAAE